MGTLTLQHLADNSRRGGDHRLAASRLLRAMAGSRHRRPTGNRAETRGKAGAAVTDASRTSDQDGPNPDTSQGGALGGRGAGGGSGRRSERGRGAGDYCGSPRRTPRTGMPKRARPVSPRPPLLAARREVSTPVGRGSGDGERREPRRLDEAKVPADAGGERRELRTGTNGTKVGEPYARRVANSLASSLAGSPSGGACPRFRAAQEPCGVAG